MRVHFNRLLCASSLLALAPLLLLLSKQYKQVPAQASRGTRSKNRTITTTRYPPLLNATSSRISYSPRQQTKTKQVALKQAHPALAAVKPGDGGYLLALTFSEQLESDMTDLHQLADVGLSWKLRVVEPYIRNTRFDFPALPYRPRGSGGGGGRLLKMSEVYDLQDLNSNLRNSLNASHDLVVPLSEVVEGGGQGYHLIVLQLVPYILSSARCMDTNVSKYVQRLASHLKCKAQACLHKTSVACVNTKERTDYRRLFQTNAVMRQALLQATSTGHKIVVLIPIWNGIRPYRDKFFYWDPTFHSAGAYTNLHATAHSSGVKSAARGLLRSLKLQRPLLGIHVRLERLLRVKPFNRTAVEDCLAAKLEKLVRNVQNRGGARGGVLWSRDYGKYGSSTCKVVRCAQFAREVGLERRMDALGAIVLEYRPKSGRIRNEHGFSANVEQEVLSRVDYLITVGYGSFQQGIVSRFRRREQEREVGHEQDKGAGHEQERIFQICSNKS